MAYLAIARKYRPATFDEIVGQEHVTRTLRNAIARKRIHHAFLFTGARGVGKTTAARALAKALNCDEGPTDSPCGTCVSCVGIASGTSPDLIEIDGASNNSVDSIREIRDTVQYAPTRGRWKIYLVDEVHMLSKAAFNALLKTLEEPPPHVVFIFATTEPNRIPDTILSRVQRFDFKRIPIPGVVTRLREIAVQEGVTISDHGLRMIARAGEGSMRDAQSLLDQVISYGDESISDEQVAETLGLIDRALLMDFLRALIDGQPDACLAVVDRVYGYGYELSEFTSELLEVLRNATFVRLSESSRRYIDVSEDELQALLQLTDGVDAEIFTRMFSAMLDVHEQVSRAARPRIVLEMAVARLATTRPLQPVGALLGRLEHLERTLRKGGANLRSPRTAPRHASPPAGGGRDRRPPRSGSSNTARSSRSGQRTQQSGPTSSKREDPPQAPQSPVSPPGPPEPPLSAYDRISSGPDDSDPPIEPDFAPSRAQAPAKRKQSAPLEAPTPSPLGRSPSIKPSQPPATAPVATPASTPSQTAAPQSFEGRWSALLARVDSGKSNPFRSAMPEWRDNPPRVRLRFDSGLEAARARRALNTGPVTEALAEFFPPNTTAEIEEVTRLDPLTREALQHPVIIRVQSILGAELNEVIALGEGE